VAVTSVVRRDSGGFAHVRYGKTVSQQRQPGENAMKPLHGASEHHQVLSQNGF